MQKDAIMVIKIPNIDRDDRIGSVFNQLFHVILATERSADKSVEWDFVDTSFSHPFFLMPLALYRNSCDKNITCVNRSDKVSQYHDLIYFDEPLVVEANKGWEDVIKSYSQKTYTPICRFNMSDGTSEKMQTVLQKVIETQSHADAKINNPLSYMLGELIGNIEQHSKSPYGYIYSQVLQRERCIDICIADSGITIYGSYIDSNKYIDKIGTDEAKALKMANEGYSTKDLPETENRGFGISTSKRMLVEGLGGSFFMFSGNAFHRHDKNGSVYVNLPAFARWEGTIILMRIPIDVPRDFNYLKYVE